MSTVWVMSSSLVRWNLASKVLSMLRIERKTPKHPARTIDPSTIASMVSMSVNPRAENDRDEQVCIGIMINLHLQDRGGTRCFFQTRRVVRAGFGMNQGC